MTVLSASGAGLAVAMLTAVLIVGAGVEDGAFKAAVATHDNGGSVDIERSNGVYIVTPIAKDPSSVQRFVNARLRRDGLLFQASATVATSPRAIVVMNDDLAENFSVLAGRLPRECTPTLCEYAEQIPGPDQLGVIPAGISESPAIRGYRFVNVGRVHERATSVVPVPPGPLAIVAGFSLVSSNAARSGNGALLWSTPSRNIAHHPWDVPRAVAATTRLEWDLRQRLGNLSVDSQSGRLEAAQAQAASDGRRLLIVSGAVLGVFLAFVIFAACRLRHDAELLHERLSVVNATNRQIQAVSLFEFLSSPVSRWIARFERFSTKYSRLTSAHCSTPITTPSSPDNQARLRDQPDNVRLSAERSRSQPAQVDQYSDGADTGAVLALACVFATASAAAVRSPWQSFGSCLRQAGVAVRGDAIGRRWYLPRRFPIAAALSSALRRCRHWRLAYRRR